MRVREKQGKSDGNREINRGREKNRNRERE